MEIEADLFGSDAARKAALEEILLAAADETYRPVPLAELRQRAMDELAERAEACAGRRDVPICDR